MTYSRPVPTAGRFYFNAAAATADLCCSASPVLALLRHQKVITQCQLTRAERSCGGHRRKSESDPIAVICQTKIPYCGESPRLDPRQCLLLGHTAARSMCDGLSAAGQCGRCSPERPWVYDRNLLSNSADQCADFASCACGGARATIPPSTPTPNT